MGQMSLLGARLAILLLIITIGATVIPLQKFHISSERYYESSEARAADEEYRLPHTATPDTYKITLTPDYYKFATFTGEVEIVVTATTDGNNISLHYDNMTIHSRIVTDVNGTVLDLDDDDDYSYNRTTNTYTLMLSNDQTFKPGEKYRIYINYTGHLRDDLVGFHRSSYKTADGEKR
jgi:aminopeptidase 2